MENEQEPSTNGTDFRFLSLVMVFSVIITFFIMSFFVFLHNLYAKWYWSRYSTEDPAHRTATATKHRGLEPSALESLPIVVYDPKDFKEDLECVVCLSEFVVGEKARILPKCDHGFHVDCIDVWFKSHSTCPLCRTIVVSTPQNPNESNDGESEEEEEEEQEVGSSQNVVFPTNVLFWGNGGQIRSLGVVNLEEGHDASPSISTSRRYELVLDIPREDCLCSPSHVEEKSPMMTRLRSLKRFLSRGKRVVMAPSPRGSSSSGGGGGVEQV